MEDTIITFKTAKLAKENGFDEKCLFFYTGDSKELKQINLKGISNSDTISFCSAPTQSLLAKWLREEYNLHISINVGLPHNRFIMYYSNVIKFGKHHKSKFKSEFYKTYEEAYEIGLQEALKLI